MRLNLNSSFYRIPNIKTKIVNGFRKGQFLNIAIMAIEKKDMDKAHANIMKTQRIIQEFQATLDHKYPVAKDFEAVYNYLMIRLREANVKKDTEILEEVLKHLRTMRDTWKEVMKLSASGGGATQVS